MTSKEPKHQHDPLSTAAPVTKEITADVINYHVQYAHKLRSAMIAAALARAWASVAALWSKTEPKRPVETLVERFANSLTAIRSSAEMLRDVDDLTEEERARFVRTVLDEEIRLEKMLVDLAGPLRRNVPVT